MLLSDLLKLLRDSASQERILVVWLLGKLFAAETDELVEETALDILEALIDILRSGEEESARFILQLLIASFKTIMTRKGEMGLALLKAMDAIGMEDVLATLCDQCFGMAETLLMELIRLLK
jgi:hypothetical protein